MSSNFESSKSLAAIGALLLFLSFVPVIGIVGIVLLLVGMKGLSEYYHDESIYMYSLRGLIFGIIGVIAVSAFSFLTFFGGILSAVELGPAAIIGGIIGVLIVLVFAFTFYLLMAINFRRAYSYTSTTLRRKQFPNSWYFALLWCNINDICRGFDIGLDCMDNCCNRILLNEINANPTLHIFVTNIAATPNGTDNRILS